MDDPRATARLLLDAADQGDLDAQALLGQILLDGTGIARDQALALTWFRIAARQGHLMAINMVGRCLENGWGCEVDLSEAASHYRRAAEAGLDWGLYNYGQLLTRGRGVTQDMPAAYRLFQRAAAKGHAKSMNLLGRFHDQGVVVNQDSALAAQWYQQAAEGGDFRGQYNHASVLARAGRLAEATTWLMEALKTATPGFLETAATVLLASPEAAIRTIGERYREALAAIP